ncbi:MAG: transcription-repair coupling factor, partial [Muribaculaceae bacterium]|nr:transcription-repair coupling factor [Muribaculaceae bacterium]
MTLKEADSIFATAPRIKALSDLLDDRKTRRIAINGLRGSAPAMLFAGLPEKKYPYLIVADDIDAAGYIYHDLCQTAGEEKVAIFTSGYRRDIKYGQPDPPSQILRTETLDAWNRKDHPLWVVTCPEALAEKVPSKKDLSDRTLTLSSGKKSDMGAVRIRLRELGFKEVDYVYEPGQFAVRGSILDVYSFSGELPYRIDFFDDEIDSIRSFNVETQLSERRLDTVSVVPAASDDNSSEGVSLLDFADPSTPVICQSVSWLESRIRSICSETISEAVSVTGEGDPKAMEKVVDPERFITRLNSMKVVEFGVPADAARSFIPEATIEFDCSLQTLFHKNFTLIADSFSRFLSEGYRILI